MSFKRIKPASCAFNSYPAVTKYHKDDKAVIKYGPTMADEQKAPAYIADEELPPKEQSKNEGKLLTKVLQSTVHADLEDYTIDIEFTSESRNDEVTYVLKYEGKGQLLYQVPDLKDIWRGAKMVREWKTHPDNRDYYIAVQGDSDNLGQRYAATPHQSKIVQIKLFAENKEELGTAKVTIHVPKDQY